ncbi:hypothetical protein BaRGS_00035569, partial [Batillaria attramentaria]
VRCVGTPKGNGRQITFWGTPTSCWRQPDQLSLGERESDVLDKFRWCAENS